MISIPIWLFTLVLCLLALLIGLAIGFAINPRLQEPDKKEMAEPLNPTATLEPTK